MDVFNHSFWKLYIKTINDLDPGLNLPESEKWLRKFNKSASFLGTYDARIGHNKDDIIVPLYAVYTHPQIFKKTSSVMTTTMSTRMVSTHEVST